MKGGRFLFVTWEGGGNVTPVKGLGAQLVARGHDVTVLARDSLRPSATEAGLQFVTQVSEGWLPVASDVLAAMEARPPDALIVDYMLPAALSAAERTGLPTAALVHTLYAPVADNSFPSIEMAGPLDELNVLRIDLGLPALARVVDVLDHVGRIIALTTPEFDGPAAVLHPHTRYVGPVIEGAGDDVGWSPPWDADDTRPLVVVSMGTTPMEEQTVIAHVLDALAELPVRTLVQLPSHIDATALALPANAAASGYVRHAAVLPHASAVVTHAGLGTVSAALTFGVPMVCIPLGRDQPLTAARVEAVGAGRVLPPDADAESIAAALTGVLEDPQCLEGAARAAADIRPYVAEHRAVAELEALVGQWGDSELPAGNTVD